MTKTTKSKLTDVEHAEQTLRELEAKARELAEAGKRDDAAMADLAFQAHTGNAQAAAKIESLTDRALRREREMKSIEAAIQTAKAKLADARAREQAEVDRKLAQEAHEITDRIDALFASADKHFAMAFDALKAADGRIEELHARGFAFPTAIQVRTNALFALQTYLMALPKYWWAELNHSGVRFLAPHERRTFAQFWARMSEPIARYIGARLDAIKQKEEAA